MSDLPDLQAGIYRHYKGPLYQVFSYGHDANAADLATWDPDLEWIVIGEGNRNVVIYIGLQLDDAHTGPRFAIRTVEDFFAWVHADGDVCKKPVGEMVHFCFCKDKASEPRPRFQYIGPSFEGM